MTRRRPRRAGAAGPSVRRRRFRVGGLSALAAVAALTASLLLARSHQDRWAIAVYAGESPLGLAPATGARLPALSAGDVTDVPAVFVADPFMVRRGPTWYLFFEVMNARTRQGDIGLATSVNGLAWTYRQVVLDEPFHLSYPCVFEWQGEYYITPETYQAGAVRLYRASDFPTRWTYVRDLVSGRDYVDPSMVRHDGRWWLFVGTNARRSDTLRLYSAADLAGPFTEHPASPIVQGDASRARPGGRLRLVGGRLLRFAQNHRPWYGRQVRAFEITELSAAGYAEREVSESPVLGPGPSAWNARGMHHVDLHEVEDGWLACVDGCRRVTTWGFGRRPGRLRPAGPSPGRPIEGPRPAGSTRAADGC